MWIDWFIFSIVYSKLAEVNVIFLSVDFDGFAVEGERERERETRHFIATDKSFILTKFIISFPNQATITTNGLMGL
jgi:hypothetical protein